MKGMIIMSRMNIAKTLKRLRERSGYTINEVGTKVGKSGKTVSGWENDRGQPDAEILMQLCDIYKVGDILEEFRQDEKNAPAADDGNERVKMIGDINSALREMDEEQITRFCRVLRALSDKPAE